MVAAKKYYAELRAVQPRGWLCQNDRSLDTCFLDTAMASHRGRRYSLGFNIEEWVPVPFHSFKEKYLCRLGIDDCKIANLE